MNENNNLTNETNNVTPIEEVKVETSSEINEPVITNTEVQNPTPESEPPKSSKASTVLLVLLFIFLFAFIIGMPYIREYLIELKGESGLSEIEKEAIEEEKRQEQEANNNKPTPTPEVEELKELVCTLPASTVGNYTLVKTETFQYNSKNQVVSSKSGSNYTFTSVDTTYDNLKKQCDEYGLKYLTHEGFGIACSYDESNIEIAYEFDLETFKTITDGTTNIQANATYKDNIETIKSTLINNGYSCQ